MRKKPDPDIVPLATLMFENGIKINEVCERANVSPGTWSRWAAGGVPDLQKLRAMRDAVEVILAEEGVGA